MCTEGWSRCTEEAGTGADDDLGSGAGGSMPAASIKAALPEPFDFTLASITRSATAACAALSDISTSSICALMASSLRDLYIIVGLTLLSGSGNRGDVPVAVSFEVEAGTGF